MNAYQIIEHTGTPLLWHDDIFEAVVREGLAAGLTRAQIRGMTKASIGPWQAMFRMEIHPDAPPPESNGRSHLFLNFRRPDGRIETDGKLAQARAAFDRRMELALRRKAIDLDPNDAAWAMQAHIVTANHLKMQGIRPDDVQDGNIPEEMHKRLSMKHGVIDAYEFALSAGAHFRHAGRKTEISIGKNVPEMVVQAFIGLPVGRITDHPALQDGRMVVMGARRLRSGTTFELPTVWGTLGSPSKPNP